MSFNFQTVENLASASGVQEGTVISKGTTEGQILGIDTDAQVFRVLVEMPFPKDENQVGARLGKKNKETGEQPVTSRIYGKVSNQPVYIQGDGQLMRFAGKLIAPVAGLEDADDDDV